MPIVLTDDTTFELVHHARPEDAQIDATVAVIVINEPDPATLVREMTRFAERAPAAAKLAYGTYETLPEVLRAGGSPVIEAIVSSIADEAAVREVLRRHVRRSEHAAVTVHEPEEAAARTIREIAKMRGSVVRAFDPNATALEIVVPTSELAEAHAMLPSFWGWPIKARGEPHTNARVMPPGVRAFGVLTRTQEAFAMQDQKGRTWFLLLFPWKEGGKTTLVLGVAGADDSSPREDLEALHSLCVSRCAEYPLPRPPPGTHAAWFASDWGWIITPHYVGPERREHSTSFANRFVFFGNRKRAVTVSHANVPSQTEIFVDRLTPQVARLAVLYFVLSFIDTALTLTIIGGHGVQELNPVLRGLLATNPAAFLLVKNALSLAALFIVVRLQLQRAGRVALWLNAALYAALDIYWITLLWRFRM